MFIVRTLHISSAMEIICGDRRVDGKDVINIMAVNITTGDEVIFHIGELNEGAAMKEVGAILEISA